MLLFVSVAWWLVAMWMRRNPITWVVWRARLVVELAIHERLKLLRRKDVF
jgi:hypothetical protein